MKDSFLGKLEFAALCGMRDGWESVGLVGVDIGSSVHTPCDKDMIVSFRPLATAIGKNNHKKSSNDKAVGVCHTDPYPLGAPSTQSYYKQTNCGRRILVGLRYCSIHEIDEVVCRIDQLRRTTDEPLGGKGNHPKGLGDPCH